MEMCYNEAFTDQQTILPIYQCARQIIFATNYKLSVIHSHKTAKFI